MTPHEQSAADRLAEAAEAALNVLVSHHTDDDNTPGGHSVRVIKQALAAYRALPKEPALPASKNEAAGDVPKWAMDAAKEIDIGFDALLQDYWHIEPADWQKRLAAIIAKYAPDQSAADKERPQWESMDDADLNRYFARAFLNRPIDERSNTYWHDDDSAADESNHEWRAIPDYCNSWKHVRPLILESKYVLPVHHGVPKDNRSRCRRAMIDMLIIHKIISQISSAHTPNAADQ